MAFEYLTNVPLDKALMEYVEVLQQSGMKLQAELIPAQQAAGRITAQPVYANICAPHYNACAMDGIAVLASDTFYATETTPVSLAGSQYVKVDTGDPLPDGYDAIIMVEDVVSEGENAVLFSPATPWQHVRQIGEDICAGEMLLTSYSKITPAATGAMLASGVLEVEVLNRPKVGIIPTGNEIIQPVEEPGVGDIIEFNSTIFSGMLNEWGAEAVVYPIVKDDIRLVEEALRVALQQCDAVVLNAGSSAGSEDYSAEAVRNVGELLYHGLAIRPGKPAILGHSGGKPILGVPGYPVSAILVLENIMKPVIGAMQLQPSRQTDSVQATLTRDCTSSLKYREFVRVNLGKVSERIVAVPLQRGAGVVTSFVKADGIMEIPQDLEGYEAGSHVQVQLLKPLADISRTLVITGSHDPLIDEVAELMKRPSGVSLPAAHSNKQSISSEAAKPHEVCMVASSHVGSMGGIFAIKRGEAHMAGVHLLDGQTGEYNSSYIKRYFPSGGVKLVECVQRVQGLMVLSGNPKGIETMNCLQREGVSYVNRQKGSGTRILCDYICERNGIDTAAIYGYEREEFTHTAVAAQVAAGNADAGLGILSAAKIYGLDFIPICTEQFDLLIDEKSLGLDIVQRFLHTLASEAFSCKLDQMGGYELSPAAGKVRA